VESGKLAIVIMAAGKGTRLKSRRPKVLHEVGGKPLVGHVIAAASTLVRPEDIVVVVGHEAEMVKKAMASTGVRFAEQTVQKGTGHAVQTAGPAVRGYENILVLSGDAPLVRAEDLRAVWAFHQAEQAAMTLVSAEPDDPHGYGRVFRTAPGSNEVKAIVEQKMLTPDQLAMREVNMGLYAFRTAPLFQHMNQLTTDNPHGELYLTDMAGVLRAAGERVVAFKSSDPQSLLGGNTIAELMALDAAMRLRVAQRLMDSGVTIFRPETQVIDSDVEIEADAVIEPYVQLLGRTRIGAGSRIRSYTVIENCTLGEDVLVRQSCVLEDSTIAREAKIGPFMHMRPGCEIGEQVHIGNFVETKKSKLHKGVKAGHLTYLGDAEIGEDTNIGAGTITCNYDGVNKHRTTIGRGAFIGSDSTLVAPVVVGDGAFIGAGSCITKEVPADALAVGRAQQMVMDGWAAARRAQQKKK
jgi:bifunctional UDP-N-acetylglucosamine pyrophosphorylase/glucosamine-1-phosphate N-acetyltransferase